MTENPRERDRRGSVVFNMYGARWGPTDFVPLDSVQPDGPDTF